MKTSPETAAAKSIIHYVTAGELLCRHTVARATGLDLKRADTVIDALQEWGWAHVAHRRHGHGVYGKPHDLSRLSEQFWQDADMTGQAALAAGDMNLERLYRGAARSWLEKDEYAPGSLGARRSEACYNTTISLLAEHYDPGDYGDWLPGALGWQALVAATTSDRRPQLG